jgi:anaerobic magnesium-protoporphyrin IX monomethyl ester cyclase
MKVMLLFPPSWTPTMPHLALPTLTAYLRPHGVEVIQRDLNLETFDEILTHAYLAQAIDRLRRDYRAHGGRWPGPRRGRVEWALAHGSQLAAQIKEAMDVIHSDAFLDGPTGLRAFQVMVQSLEVASLAFYPAALELSTYTPAAPVDRSRSLLPAVRDPQHNMFLDIFRHGIVADIEREEPDVVGISIATLEQMLAGMTLGHLIKEAGLPCHVTVGGPHISILRGELLQVPALFDLFDSAVVFEGEKPLLRLVEALDGDGDLSRVPNLIYKDDGQIRTTPREEPERIADLPSPDFDGLPLDRYLAPRLVLPLLTSHGCYHGQCAFCNVGYGEPTSFCQLPAERVVERMMALHDRYGVQHIFFADEAITPRNLKHMSPLLEALGAPIHWCGCARFEKALTKELLEGMARGGCRMLLFGLETASEPIIQRMAKGTQREHMGRILREGAEAGIWNHVFFFFGFPGETVGHAQETVNFVYEHKHAVHSASSGTFVLERYAPVYCNPAKYGITRVLQDPERDLAIYFDYEVESGMDEAMAQLVVSRFVDVLPEKRFGHYYVNDIYRFLYASDLRDRGAALPPWLVPEETAVSP